MNHPQDTYPWCGGHILSPKEATQKAEELKREGKKLVTLNGSFDLLHPGHVIMLDEAAKQGDVVFVGMNTDASIQQYKSPDRPIIPEHERLAMLCAIRGVDFVVPIEDTEAGSAILNIVRPHVHVNGSEYGDPTQWVEWPTMETLGVAPYVVTRRAGLATTDIINKIRSLT